MRTINNKIDLLKESPTRKIDAIREKLKRENKDIIVFSAGQPSIPPPIEIRELMGKLLKEESMNLYGYTPSQGILELREAISDDLKLLGGIDVNPSNIVITAGGQAAMFSTLATLLEPGDEVILFDPTYFGYKPLLDYNGAKIVRHYVTMEKDFQPNIDDIANIISKKTKAIILVSPDNPTGRIIDHKSAKGLAEIAIDNDIWIINDEAYKTLIYEGEHEFLYKYAPDNIISINTFSKDPSIPGWRLGYVYGPKNVIDKIKLVNEEMVYCPPSFAQHMVTRYLRSDIRLKYIKDVINEYRKRRDVMINAIKKRIPKAKYIIPKGSMFVFVDLKEYINDGEEFSANLLEKYQVASVPGNYFSEKYLSSLRLSFVAEKPERIEKGIEIISKALE
ncbi:aspartate/tyrosine/aromatic aminotransferase [Caldisphaera lagunensis DSM 15908]|uniref:Aspartate/tyrosine/aromatic aminotransferase n=1 Tax=Caldisphaera lagunensis (strain DSM 15908 / JCM 11604 / ANMR 0165 / IC-154) TaxID=1056495 RepID=L0AAK7_CALLD|nr:pyridoxal phosphate-dependent aminotransferase [Caldisphaera lagunensis]AFZ70916.1 aspartate/tyrosine/aromatic aminotransferase [Caldisphaera lagunensis DSM 15908]